jgi:hypothetical protein
MGELLIELKCLRRKELYAILDEQRKFYGEYW